MAGSATAEKTGNGTGEITSAGAPGQGEGGELATSEIVVEGNAQLSMFDAGGKKPTSSSLRLMGGKALLIDGKALKKGSIITGTFTAQVGFVGQQDKRDPKTGIVVDCEQIHRAVITDLTVDTA